MEGLGLVTEWVGVSDKDAALPQVCARYGVEPEQVLYLGDGYGDTSILERVGIGCSVATGHPGAVAAADFVTQAAGGVGAAEEVIDLILSARAA